MTKKVMSQTKTRDF